MSTRTRGEVYCDDRRCVRSIDAESSAAARAEAKARGWSVHTRRVGRDGLLDFCPSHRADLSTPTTTRK